MKRIYPLPAALMVLAFLVVAAILVAWRGDSAPAFAQTPKPSQDYAGTDTCAGL